MPWNSNACKWETVFLVRHVPRSTANRLWSGWHKGRQTSKMVLGVVLRRSLPWIPNLKKKLWRKTKKTLSWHFPQLKTHQSKTFFLEREIFELDFKVFYLTSAHTSFFQIKLWKVAMIFNIIWKSRKNASNWRKKLTSDNLKSAWGHLVVSCTYVLKCY